MTITNIILTNQRRSYKSEHLQQKLDKIDMSYHLQRCVIIIGGASAILVWQSVKKTFKSSKMWCVSNVVYSIDSLAEIKVTGSYLGLDRETIECQDEEPYHNCTTRSYLEIILEQCGCLPKHLGASNKV